jgi:hypothetical protein
MSNDTHGIVVLAIHDVKLLAHLHLPREGGLGTMEQQGGQKISQTGVQEFSRPTFP